MGEVGGPAYGTSPGNLGNMAPGTVEAVVASPSYATGLGKEHTYADHAKRDNDGHRRIMTEKGIVDPYYGTDPAQLGNMAPGSVETEQPSTFWAASRTILEQCFALLTPSGHAIWIVKSYCREGAIVDFPGQWRAVAEDVGFVTLHEHHAMLVEDYGTQGGLFGEDTVHQTARKSFFRRLHEAKRPGLAIDYEVVLCMQKPGGGGEGERHGVEACISSPPYAGAGEVLSQHNGIDWSKAKEGGTTRTPAREASGLSYGSTPGQLGAMPPGTVAMVISSPPYAEAA